jgi:casein kinase II subunit beta
MKLMEEKYKNVAFGRCPRVMCSGQSVLPVGQSDVMREASVKIFCPKCNDIYYPRSSRHKSLDGAFWGTTFPHLFLMQFPDYIAPKSKFTYVSKIYGFRVHKTALMPKVGEEDKDSKTGVEVAMPGTHAASAQMTPANTSLGGRAGASGPQLTANVCVVSD